MPYITTSVQWIPQGVARVQPITAIERDNMMNVASPEEESQEEQWETESEGSEPENLEIRDTDFILLATRVGEGASNLLEHTYDTVSDAIFPRLAFDLSFTPFNVSWCNTLGTHTQGQNFCAVVGDAPFIEIYNLDVKDEYRPEVILGGCKKEDDNYSDNRSNVRLLRKDSHKDDIACCDWNRYQTNLLCTGSADKTAKLWDIDTLKLLHTFEYPGTVKCAKWHVSSSGQENPKVLVTVNGEGESEVCSTVKVYCLEPYEEMTWSLGEIDIEEVAWNPFNSYELAIAGNDGSVYLYDFRKTKKPVWTLEAHDGACHTVGYSPHIRGVLLSGGADSEVRLWDTRGAQPLELHPKAEESQWKSIKVGEVLTVGFHPNNPNLLAVGGDGDNSMAIVHDLKEGLEEFGFRG